MRRKVIAAVAFASLLPAAAYAEQQTTNYDQRFLQNVGEADQGEVQIAQLAQQSQQTAVQLLANVIAADHTQHLQQAQTLSQQKGVTLAQGANPEQQRLLSEMAKDQGSEKFDRDFVEGMIKDHEEDIEEYAEYVASSGDVQIRRFAEQTLPVLTEHLVLAVAARDVLEGTAQISSFQSVAATQAALAAQNASIQAAANTGQQQQPGSPDQASTQQQSQQQSEANQSSQSNGSSQDASQQGSQAAGGSQASSSSQGGSQ